MVLGSKAPTCPKCESRQTMFAKRRGKFWCRRCAYEWTKEGIEPLTERPIACPDCKGTYCLYLSNEDKYLCRYCGTRWPAGKKLKPKKRKKKK